MPPFFLFVALLLLLQTNVKATYYQPDELATNTTHPLLLSERQQLFLNSTPMYRQVVANLNKYTLQTVPNAELRLDSFTPFCSNFKKPTAPAKSKAECLRWEENELDMLLMYIDLIAVSMKKGLASSFYQEIRCLSRAHTTRVPGQAAWEVCFERDYSVVVGTLLAKYVALDPSAPSTVGGQTGGSRSVRTTTFRQQQKAKKYEQGEYEEEEEEDEEEEEEEGEGEGDLEFEEGAASRFLFGSWGNKPVNRHNRGSFLLQAFGSGSGFRLYGRPWETKRQTSCCKQCTQSNYFVNVEHAQCLRNPFGRHCCHKACKALGRLRIGMSSSVSHCCRRCVPLQCAR